MEKNLVSIIIACYNAEAYIDDCMNSLLNQSYQNFEIIVCDDASKDNSLSILKTYETKDLRINVLSNDTNQFAAFSRNRCLELSKGDYIMIQDIDDASEVHRIEKLIAAIENANVDFASSAVYQFEANINDIKGVIHPQKLEPTKYDFLWNLPFHHPTTMFKRECIMSVGGYRVSSETRRGQDYDMFMRMYAQGYKGINVDEPLYYFRVDAANIGRRTWAARKDEMKIRYRGFKAMKLMPIGLLFALKPIPAHFAQKIKYRKHMR